MKVNLPTLKHPVMKARPALQATSQPPETAMLLNKRMRLREEFLVMYHWFPARAATARLGGGHERTT
jgi:hypothetical protein